jgi:hypothetical protein
MKEYLIYETTSKPNNFTYYYYHFDSGLLECWCWTLSLCLLSSQKNKLYNKQATFFIFDHIEPDFFVFFIADHLTTRKLSLLHHEFFEVDDVWLDIFLKI